MKRWGIVLLVCMTGCRKDDSAEPPRVAPAADAAPVAKPEPRGPALPWDSASAKEDAHAALQGAWVVQGFGSYGRVQAWLVEGKKVTVYEAKDGTETADELIFSSPCNVRLKEAGWGGTFVKTADGKVHLGLGSGGYRIGENLVACAYGTVWMTPASCKLYRSTFDEWEVFDAECKVEGRKLTIKAANGYEDELRFVDDATMMTDQLKANAPEKMPDWAAARAKADALVAK